MIDNPKKSWSVGYKMKIDSNLDDLWNIITKPGHLELVHPFCKENYPIVWDNEKSKDVLIYTNGIELIREFKTWKEKKGYSLDCLLYTSPSPRDRTRSRMPSSA